MTEDMPEPEGFAELARLRRRAVGICIATTAGIACLELAIGRLCGLISVTAEGLHTAADLLDSLVVYVLVALAARPADRDHPFGHGKFDSLASIIEGACVGAAAIWAMVKATLVLLGFDEAHPRPEAASLIAMVVASCVYLPTSAYVQRLARQTRSPAVFAEAMHLRTHIYITLGLLGGLALTRVGQSQGWPIADRLDAAMALVLGVVLLIVAYRVILPGYRQMMDTAIGQEELGRITACISEFRDQFVEVHAIRARQAGTDRHVHIHLVVDAELTVQAAHDLAHRIEDRLAQLDPGTHLVVHVEPAVGQALAEYVQRRRVGVVLDGQQSPAEREDTHHARKGAHNP